MQSLTWYVHRLSRMSVPELCYRTLQMSRSHATRLARSDSVPEPQPARSVRFIEVAAPVEGAPYVAQAERIMAGRFDIFDLENVQLGHPPVWNRDPLTGRLAPLRHASTLDYRDERVVGNIKYLWEPSRHLHVPALAQAYALTNDMRYADAMRLHIESWIDQCPPHMGVHWTSSLELAIRLINWSIAWQLIGGERSPLFAGPAGTAFRKRWLASVFLQARAIATNLSRFSSANNHLIGETAGVWIASVTWNGWPKLRRWGERCAEILEREMLKQNAPDGGNREQAFAYQQFVLDFGLLAGLAARAAGRNFSKDYWTRLESMVDFIASIMDVGGNMPMVGDADDGYVVRLAPESGLGQEGLRESWPHTTSNAMKNLGARDLELGPENREDSDVEQLVAEAPRPKPHARSPEQPFDNFRSLIATGAVLFDRADLARKAGCFDDKSRWLLGRDGEQRFEALLARAPKRYTGHRAFPYVGYYVLGDRMETPDEIKMLVDAGPLGYLSIAAHGHADALSFVLSVGGEEVLVDPGTYAYHTAPEWRTYFRSTRAHNTVVVDGLDQSDQSGNFMWSRHADARCLEFSGGSLQQRFIGEHDGYRVLRDPLTHRREVQFDAHRRLFTIVDTFECRTQHTVRWHWHCAEDLMPILTDREIVLETRRHRIRIVAKRAPDRVLSFHGGKPSEGGWVSRSFGCKEPAATVAWESRIDGTTTAHTYICIEPLDEEVSRDRSAADVHNPDPIARTC